MKTFRLPCALRTLVLAGSLFTQLASADPLPNAWQITHNTTTAPSTLIYSNLLTSAQHSAATNNPTGGFRFTVNARFVTDYNDGGETMTMIYGLGSKRFLIWWGLTNNNLTARLENGITYTLTTNGTGSALYHTHEILYNPTNGTASYLVDGVVKTTNWPPSGNAWAAGSIAWGAGSSTSKGQMNFNRVTFAITNTVVAEYDAGTEPTNAPDPRTQGWTNSPANPPATSTNGISPDRGPGVVTTLADSGYGSLRQSIADAHDGDIITFATNGTITLSSEIFLTNDLTIVGPGAANLAISGSNARRVFEIDSGVTASISGLTIRNGNNTLGGGIFNGGALTVASCAFSNNSASGFGGGIYINIGGTLVLIDSTFSSNSADGGGGICNSGGVVTVTNCGFFSNSASSSGGGLLNNASLTTVSHSTFSANSAAAGGGIGGSNGGTNMVVDCTFSGNSAIGGGGIGGGGINMIANCTFSANSAATSGGGIYNSSGTNTLNNCTLSGNSAENGGGFYGSGGRTTFTDSTFFGNSASASGGGIFMNTGVNIFKNSTLSGNSATSTGGGIYQDFGSSVLTNTIVAGNISANSANIFISTGTISGVNNLTNGAPLLAPLGNYGGPTQTMPPLAGSPAIDAGLDSITNSLPADQRGYPRLSGAHVDIGAVEIQPPFIVLNANDSGAGSLRAAIAAVTDLITFTNTLSGQTIHLTSGQLTIARGLSIDASALAKGPTLDAGGNSRVLEITNASVTLDSLTVTNGNAWPGNGGGILLDSGAALTINNSTFAGNSADGGGGLYNNNGTLTVTNCTIAGNAANFGGGLDNRGLLTVNDSVISGNSATNNGGGIDNSGAAVTVNNSTFSGNSAFNGGGINYYQSTLTVSNCTLINNSAGGYGGGINSLQSTGTVNNSAFSGNTSRDGGGLENGSGKLTVSRSTFSGNSTTQNGGGIDSTFGTNTLNNCTFTGNSAAWSGGGLANYYGTSVLTNCTLVGNSAGDSGGGIVDWGTISTVTRVMSSIVSGNAGSDVDFYPGSSNRVVSAGHNLIGIGSALASFNQTGDLTNAAPLVAPLGGYGGPTQTMPPLAGSPAIDAGLDSITNSLPTDQRGYPRKSGAHVDLGAVESQLAPTNNRPRLTNLAMQAGGSFQFGFTNVPNADFTVLTSTNVGLPLNLWIPLGLATQSGPGEYQFTDPAAANFPARFYQVIWP